MIDLTIKILWMLLPAGAANAFPPIATKLLPKLNYPMDFNLKLNGKRIFGNHKTFRGLISGVVVAHLVFAWQKSITNVVHFGTSDLVAIYSILPSYFGLLMGFSALSGDAIKSFVKRQIGLHPGKPWFPWDQIDWVISSNICLALYIGADLYLFLYSLIIGFVASVIAKTTGRLVGINDTYF